MVDLKLDFVEYNRLNKRHGRMLYLNMMAKKQVKRSRRALSV